MVDITTGGIRDRLLRDAAAAMLHAALDQLHWFDAGNAARMTWAETPVDGSVTVPLGTIALEWDQSLLNDEFELGSNLAEYRHVVYVDVYGHDEDSARQVIGDVRDILLGKMPAIGAEFPILDVYDTTQSPVPPDPAFQVLIESVEDDRPFRETSKPWQRFWLTCKFELVEER